MGWRGGLRHWLNYVVDNPLPASNHSEHRDAKHQNQGLKTCRGSSKVPQLSYFVSVLPLLQFPTQDAVNRPAYLSSLPYFRGVQGVLGRVTSSSALTDPRRARRLGGQASRRPGVQTARRITLSVNNPEVEESDLRLVTLEVFPEWTVETLRSSIEAEGIPAPSQHLYHNGQLITDNSKTLQELAISDGDMLALHIRDMRGNTGVAPTHQAPQPAQRPAPSASQQDPERIRLQVLGDPRLRGEVQRANPPLAAALDDPQRFAQIFRQSQDHQEEARLARLREIEQLNNDEFNPEAQARIEEIIRQQGVMENLQNAMEHHPESFGRVHMLYVDVKVNGVKVKALVDSGAQATIMSPSCAEACNIMHLVDRRFAGVARGIGTANIIGRVHSTMLQVGSKYLSNPFTVMEGKSVDLILGLDILKGHQAIIDLARNKLIIQGEEVNFLGESEIPKETEDAVNDEPTVQGPGGTTIGARSGVVTAPTTQPGASSAPPAARNTPSGSVPTRPAGGPARATPPQAPASTFPEKDIEALINLGVDRRAAIQALEATDGNVEYAANLIFQSL